MTAPLSAGGLQTFEKIVQTIADTLGRSDLMDQIPDFIRLVEHELERDIPLRDSEYVVDGEFTGNDEFIELPSNLLTLRHIRINTSSAYSLNIVSIDKLNDIRTNGRANTLPSAAAMVGKRLYLAPTPTTTDTYTLIYRGALAPLSQKNPSNKVLEDAPDCILYGALMHSAPFIGDDARTVLWGQLYERAKMSYKQMEYRNRTGGGPLQIRPDMQPNDSHSFRGRQSNTT
jgi:hypothetical protein